MQNPSITRSIAAGVLALSAAALSTNAAAVIKYTPWQSANVLLEPTNGTIANLAFDQYDPTVWGYDLHNLELNLDGTGYTTYKLTDASNSNNTFTFIADITINAGGLIVTVPTVTDIERTVGPFGEYTAPGFGPPTDFADPGVLQGTNSNSVTYVGGTLTPAIIAMFSGAGTVIIPTSAGIVNLTTSDGDNDTSLRSAYSATLQVRYSYDEPQTPEPATLLLLGIGVAGAGAVSRRRRNKQAA